jgi:GNAT superfamily N-acetyltransferase
MTADLTCRAPATPDEWEAYYDLRWRVLRAPWHQPRGTERAASDATADHRALWTPDQPHRPLAVGCVQPSDEPATEPCAQIRWMAVEPAHQGTGLGQCLMHELEALARAQGYTTLVLNARENALAFYRKLGYTALNPATPDYVLFGAIPHYRMVKHTR